MKMESYITEDVDALLKLKKGDSERLNRIKNLCENKKLISISDRKYVERLASQYLHKPEKKPTPPSQTFIPKVEPYEETHPKDDQSAEKIVESPQIMDEPQKISKSTTTKIQPASFELSSKGKIIIGISAILIAIVVIYAVSINGTIVSIPEKENQPTINLIPPYIFLETDEQSYQKADIISISGESDPIIDGKIRVVVENTDGQIIWAENVQVKETGEFSTLLIAGGQGWEKSGQYSLIATFDRLERKISFDFTA